MILFEENTRGRILKESTALMSTFGYQKASTREIANAVHITPAALYNHFPSKQAILMELMDILVRQLESFKPGDEEWLSIIRAGGLDAALDRLIYTFPEEQNITLVRLMRIMHMSAFTIAEVTELYHNYFLDGHTEYLEKVFGMLLAEGKIPSIDIPSMAQMVADAVNYRAFLAGMFKDLSAYMAYAAASGKADMIAFRKTVHAWLTHDVSTPVRLSMT